MSFENSIITFVAIKWIIASHQQNVPSLVNWYILWIHLYTEYARPSKLNATILPEAWDQIAQCRAHRDSLISSLTARKKGFAGDARKRTKTFKCCHIKWRRSRNENSPECPLMYVTIPRITSHELSSTSIQALRKHRTFVISAHFALTALTNTENPTTRAIFPRANKLLFIIPTLCGRTRF